MAFFTLVTWPAAVSAQQGLPPPGTVLAQIGVVTDYRYDGVSESDARPVLQGGAYLALPKNCYLGLWASGVDFRDVPHTPYELDLLGGRVFQIDTSTLTLEGMASLYPQKRAPGPTYDFFQAKAKVSRWIGKTVVEGSLAWSPSGSYGAGETYRLEGIVSRKLNPYMSLDVSVGQRWVRHGFDRTFWSVGGVAKWRGLGFGLHYVDNSLGPHECGFFADWCRPALIGKVTYTFSPGRLRRGH